MTLNEKIIAFDLSDASADNWVKHCETRLSTIDELVNVQRKTDTELWALGYEYCGLSELSFAEHDLSAARLYKRLLPQYREYISKVKEDNVSEEYDKVEALFEKLSNTMSADEMDAANADEVWTRLTKEEKEK